MGDQNRSHSAEPHRVGLRESIEPRTREGDAFTSFVGEVASLGDYLTAAGEVLAQAGGQSLARWIVMEAIATDPATLSEIARRRGMAPQSVQRIADVLVREGFASHGAAIGLDAVDRAREHLAKIRPLVSMPVTAVRKRSSITA